MPGHPYANTVVNFKAGVLSMTDADKLDQVYDGQRVYATYNVNQKRFTGFHLTYGEHQLSMIEGDESCVLEKVTKFYWRVARCRKVGYVFMLEITQPICCALHIFAAALEAELFLAKEGT
jgi:hypothetical protein